MFRFVETETPPRRLADGVFMVGGPDLSDPRDCLCYLVTGSSARVLIDVGAGPSVEQILALAEKAGGKPPTHLVLTHAHIDHAGGAAEMRRLTGCQVIIHQADAPTLLEGDAVRSAASWYGLHLDSLEPDLVLDGDHQIDLGEDRHLHLIPTPGHTPGSISAWCQAGEFKVLFGQDVHGPFNASFGSDLNLWRQSMDRLLALEADILAEGHFGVFRPASEVRAFLESQLAQQR